MAESVRNALVEVLGAEAAADFPSVEVDKLEKHGYMSARRLRIATREGLERINLLEACIDDVMTAMGEFPMSVLTWIM